MLKIFNTLTQEKELFEPTHPERVNIYVCGMTVYDYSHIGHARSIILFDVIVRYLRSIGYTVNYVRNITDIDDKIINRAHENNETYDALTERFIKALHDDEQALGVLSPDHEPRATEYIPQIIDLIQTLVDREHAYVADNGDVYFDIKRFKDYGKLARRDLDKLRAGARVEIESEKRDPLDFSLWKKAKPDEPHWDSPWGAGRPGWHIECSAMSTSLLGQPFDIHGGGMDLKFPHHENEIAQSEAAFDKTFAKIWMHVGLLQINREKMSKSLGNFYTINEVLENCHPEVLRYFMISGHYRSPVNYSADTMEKMQTSLAHLYLAIRDLPESEGVEEHYQQKFQATMNDDFNTPEALAVLFDLSHDINRLKKEGDLQQAGKLGATLKLLASVFGILQQEPEQFLKGDITQSDIEKINQLISERTTAREQKNWQRADEIREELNKLNVVIEDTSEGVSWRKL